MLQSIQDQFPGVFALFHSLKRICLIVLGGLLLCASTLMMLGGWMMWAATSKWPSAEGRILKFEVQPLKNHPTKAQLDLEYQYTVNGQAFSGDTLSPVTTTGQVSRRLAERKRGEYSVGRNVDIIYDPNNPSRGFLEAPNLLWDVLLHPGSIGCLGVWMIYLFFQTRRRRVPDEIAAQLSSRFGANHDWSSVFESVIDREYVTLTGVASYSEAGGLFAGWPRCQIALVASPNEFLVVAGPYTIRGIASSIFTLVLEVSLSRFWLPAMHGFFFLVEIWQRRINWRHLGNNQISRLVTAGSAKVVSIDEAVVYGFESRTKRLWFRLPERQVDEFIQVGDDATERVAEFVGFIGLMQNAKKHS